MLQYMVNGLCGLLGLYVAALAVQVYNIDIETAIIRNQHMTGITVLEMAVNM